MRSFLVLASDSCFPPTVVYDDGCHLAKFIQNHFGKDLGTSPASTLLKDTPFSVDRVHFKNHVGRWCRANMDPENNRCTGFLFSDMNSGLECV